MKILRVEKHDPVIFDELVRVLIAAVNHGASIGFLSPLDRSDSELYWKNVFDSLKNGICLWIAEEEGRVLGTVQLSLCLKQNGLHRAEVQKLIVDPASRGRGVAEALMSELESQARQMKRNLLFLDTEVGSKAEFLYSKWGWKRAGEIPDYALNSKGELHATALFYKKL